MTSIIRMIPLSGGGNDSPHCYLLEVDGFNFLLDCGWDEKFNMDFIKELKKHVPKVDAVLISYPDHLHLGALPYSVGKLGLACPIYATVPVHKMGQMFMYDLYQARHNIEDFNLFTLDEVDLAFDKMTQLQYNQTVSLKGKGQGLTITPLSAGHMIGGTIWRIVKEGEEDIVYAVDFNHKKERHLNGCEIDKLSRPSLLITDAFNATYNLPRRRNRDEQLMTNILSTLRNGGNVLVAVDTAGRVLELAHMVDQLWSNKDSGLLAYSLALLNNVSYNVVEFAKSQIEWMSEKLMKVMGEKKTNPFQFRHLKLCHSMADLNRVPSPKVVLASMPDLECGFARELFMAWCSNPKHSIILTSRCSSDTLGGDLIQNGGDRVLNLEVRKRVKLTGSELEEFKAKEREQSKKFLPAGLVEDALDESSDSDEEMEPLRPGEKKIGGKAVKHDILMKPETKKQTGFFKSNKSKYPMYPLFEEKIKYDDYGEIIRVEDFMMDVSESIGVQQEVEKQQLQAVPKDDDRMDQPEVPTKCVSTWQNFEVQAKIQYIDFEGRTDPESIYKLMTGLRPRRVILVRGDDTSLTAMASYCRDLVGGSGGDKSDKVFTPHVGQVVDATTERFIYQVRLRDSLFSKLTFTQAKTAQIAWLDGILKTMEEIPDITQNNEDEEDEEVTAFVKPIIPVLEPVDDDKVPGHATSFVNELKLSDFKLVLTRNGIPSEFQQGNLTCGQNSNVLLRRHESGRIMMEGCLSEDYYVIRTLLYQQYAIV